MEYKKVCENCGKKYKAKNSRSKFCKDYCRVESNRRANKEKPKAKSKTVKKKAVKKAALKKKASVKKAAKKAAPKKRGNIKTLKVPIEMLKVPTFEDQFGPAPDGVPRMSFGAPASKDENKVSFTPSNKKNKKGASSLVDMITNADIKVKKAIVSQPPSNRRISYADLLSLAKTGKLTAEEIAANKDINSNQKSMLRSKLKK